MKASQYLRPLFGLTAAFLLTAGSPPEQRERPDDAPAAPVARPEVGARTEVTFGAFTHIQVNVFPGGANIVGDAANEPSIAVDPNRPNNIAIGWRQFDNIASNFRQAGVGYSKNGGRSWLVTVLDPGVFRSDPVLDFDADGNFYYNSLKVVGSVFDCWVFKSGDGGATWGAPVYSFGGDKQWMTIDRTGGLGRGHLYQWWSQAAGCCGSDVFTRSTDGVLSFETPIAVPNTPIWGTMDIAPDGTLYFAGVNINNMAQFFVVKSTDADNALVTPTFTSTQVIMGGLLVGFPGANSPNPGGLLGQVQLAVNPVNGHVYLLASVQPLSADPLEVHFTRSEDGGATWSPYVRVNDDATFTWQWFSTMSVAPNGRIDVVWNDGRDFPLPNLSALYYASSTDGGTTWSANKRISPGFDSHLGWPNQNKIGDYYDMISDNVGASLAWAATFNGEQDVYYVRIGDYDCNTNGIADTLDLASGTSYDQNTNGIPDECEPGVTAVPDPALPAYALGQNRPNPFNPSTTIEFDVPAPGGQVRLRVIDVSGRQVRTLADARMGPGHKSATWDGRDDSGRLAASGVYFYRLDGPGYSATRKMLLLK